MKKQKSPSEYHNLTTGNAIAKLLAAIVVFTITPSVGITLIPHVAAAQEDTTSALYSAAETVRRNAALKSFLKLLKASNSQEEGRKIVDQIWKFWLIGPNEEATNQLAAAMRERDSYNFEKSLSILQGLVEKYPLFTEARNQRAFLYFLTEKYDASLADLDSVVTNEPEHFAAHAGRGLVLIRQGHDQLAQSALKRARSIHPWIKERHLIVE